MTVRGKRLPSDERGELRQFDVVYRVPLAGYTSWGIGGPAQIMVFPRQLEDIRILTDYAAHKETAFNILGGGSNVLVKDEGIPGMLLCLKKGFKNYEFEGPYLKAQAGVLLSELVRAAAIRGFSGLESLTGIPGTLGGAVRGNAGTREGHIGQVIENVSLWVNNKLVTLNEDEITFGYRKTGLPEGAIILEAGLKLVCAPVEQIKRRMAELLKYRRKHQPLGEKSAGCVFMNPAPEVSAGALIEQAGLKGIRMGDAMVSPKHANFIINCGRATAGQILALIELIQKKVRQVHGIELELEVNVLG